MAKPRADRSNSVIDHMDDAELLAHLIRALQHPPPDSVLEAIERAIEGPTAH